jgi:hypothetical protein
MSVPGYPKLSYRAVPGQDHAYTLFVQARPHGTRVAAGIVRRHGTLPSMRGWAALGNWDGSTWTRTRQTCSDAAADLWAEWQSRQGRP